MTTPNEVLQRRQLLKLAGVVEDGAMARMVIDNDEVTVDGAVEHRRGRQIRPGMTVEYAGETVRVVATAG